MGVMVRVLRGLFPTVRIVGDFRLLQAALGASLDRLRLYLRGIVTESIPSGATTTLEAWYHMLGLPYDATLTTKQLQLQARQAWTATGGAAIKSLRETIQIAFPHVDIETMTAYADVSNMAGAGMAGRMQAIDYPSWYTPSGAGEYPVHNFYVTGTVDDIQQLLRLAGLLDRIKPAHMHEVYNVTNLSTSGTGQAGLGMAGIMEAGRE